MKEAYSSKQDEMTANHSTNSESIPLSLELTEATVVEIGSQEALSCHGRSIMTTFLMDIHQRPSRASLPMYSFFDFFLSNLHIANEMMKKMTLLQKAVV